MNPKSLFWVKKVLGVDERKSHNEAVDRLVNAIDDSFNNKTKLIIAIDSVTKE